jgi:hypothetical protein
VRPNSSNQISLGYEHTAAIAGAEGLQPYESINIRLSAVLCAMGFALRDDAQPALPIVDSETRQTRIVFFHKPILPPDSEVTKTLPKLTAAMIGLWWTDPTKYLIEGYDDALLAMRRVFEAREFLIKVVKGAVRVPNDGRLQRSTVTESLHIASVIKACGEPLVAFDRKTFVFKTEAARIAALIDAEENGNRSTRLENQKVGGTTKDLCVDWMLWALKYRDWLGRIVRNPECVPMIERRHGDCFLRVRADMPKTLRREFTRKWP